MKKTAGCWRPTDPRGIYFLACPSGFVKLVAEHYRHLLTAVDQLQSEKSVAAILQYMRTGKKVMIDSGVYAFAAAEARRRNVSIGETLGKVPVEEMPGFNQLKLNYINTLKRVGPESWGYVEIDLGGTEQKKKTRAQLEAAGLKPIPVFHVYKDPLEYLDELTDQYDRICIGNVVREQTVRTRIIHLLLSKRKKNPKLWVHLLGVTPNETMMAYRFDSSDSSQWASSLRWGRINERAMLKDIGFSELKLGLGKSKSAREKFIGTEIFKITCQMRDYQHAHLSLVGR